MNEFTKTDGKIYVNVPYAEAYIAKELMCEEDKPSAVATPYGDGFKLIGMFNMRFFDDDKQPRDSVKLRTFNYPNVIITQPTTWSIETLALSPFKEPEQYYVFKYYFGDMMMDAEVQKDHSNCTKFLFMIMSGKIPETIPYDQFIKIWETNFAINGIDPGVPSLTLQLIWAEMCKNPSDLTYPFRKIVGRGGANILDYVQVNMDTTTSGSSVFSSIAFQKVTEKLATSMNMTKEGKEQRKSPVERVLTM